VKKALKKLRAACKISASQGEQLKIQRVAWDLMNGLYITPLSKKLKEKYLQENKVE
jgi:hypothetical protein